jgi:hypothetical protein
VGPQGSAGQSAYDLWLAQGNTGTAQDFLSASAYQIWLAQGNTGTQQTFLNTLVGPTGANGTSIIWKGSWDINLAYFVGDVVEYNGSSYVCTVNITSLDSPPPSYAWELLAQKGATGAQGIQGPVGATGPAGASGSIGATGATGPQGPIGLTGAAGPQGLQGPAGNDGAAGAQGLQGIQGTAGVNGINGLNALIKTTTESAGVNCTNGGTKIETGLDANGNGILDIVEVNTGQTKYVCNGTNTSSSQDVMIGISSSTTWTCPSGVTQITVELWGGGGGGAYGQSGGNGGYNRSTINVIQSNTYNVVIGNGGNAAITNASNSNGLGASGGASSFGGVLSASGGTGGACCWLGGSAANGAVINWPYSSISAPGYIPSHFFSIPSRAPGGSAGNPNGAPAPTAGSSGFAIIRY